MQNQLATKPYPFRVNIGNSDISKGSNCMRVAGTLIRAEHTECDRNRENQPPHICIQHAWYSLPVTVVTWGKEKSLFSGEKIALRRKQLLALVCEIKQAKNFKEEDSCGLGDLDSV